MPKGFHVSRNAVIHDRWIGTIVIDLRKVVLISKKTQLGVRTGLYYEIFPSRQIRAKKSVGFR